MEDCGGGVGGGPGLLTSSGFIKTGRERLFQLADGHRPTMSMSIAEAKRLKSVRHTLTPYSLIGR